jgi:hypothetical protein
MTAATLLKRAARAGVTLWADGGAIRYQGPREALAWLLPELKAHKPDILAALGAPALSAVSPDFAARLSPEDLADTAAGDTPLATVQAFEQAAIQSEAEDLREFFEERAGILEHYAGLARPEAELEAARITATYARNRGYRWASLRAALAGYPELLSELPDKPGPVDALPLLGLARLAVLPGRRVLRQAAFCRGLRPERAGSAPARGRRHAGRRPAVQHAGSDRGEGHGAMTTEPEPRFEWFRLSYPSGTLVMSYYACGAPLEEVKACHPTAMVEPIEGPEAGRT